MKVSVEEKFESRYPFLKQLVIFIGKDTDVKNHVLLEDQHPARSDEIPCGECIEIETTRNGLA